jgi:hypothetical protein
MSADSESNLHIAQVHNSDLSQFRLKRVADAARVMGP